MNKNNNPALPIELIREILLRLPVRSVLRFKCVCKSWLCVINDPQFGFSHYDLDATPSHRLLLRSTRFYIETLDIETSLENYGGGVHVLIPPPPPPPPGTYDSYGYSRLDSLMIYPRDGRVILGSCRGIVALYYTGSNDLVIWNPSTGLHKSLPQFGDRIATDDYLYGFGYDPSTDDYLITLIKLDDKYGNADDKVQIQIFSFKTGWFSFMKVKALYMDCGCRLRGAALFNDTLHWCVFSVDKRQSVIIAFDLKRRSLSEVPLFDHFTVEEYIIYSLRVMGAHLSVCCWVHSCPTIEIWMMKEYKVQSSWSVYIVLPTYGGERFSPICFTKDGQIFGSNTRQRLEKINDKGDKVDFFRYGIGAEVNQVNLQSAMYRESLLPLPSVCKK